jgi:hypothetical protein
VRQTQPLRSSATRLLLSRVTQQKSTTMSHSP